MCAGAVCWAEGQGPLSHLFKSIFVWMSLDISTPMSTFSVALPYFGSTLVRMVGPVVSFCWRFPRPSRDATTSLECYRNGQTWDEHRAMFSCCIQQEQFHVCGVGSIARAVLHVEFRLSHGLGIAHMAKTGRWQREASDSSSRVSFLGLECSSMLEILQSRKDLN